MLSALLACESTPVLVYHHVGVALDVPRYVTVPALRAQLQYLAAEGYTPITVSTYEEILAGRQAGPRRPILLTFDDGDWDFYQHGYPELKALGIPATMFLISGVLGEDEASRVRNPWPYLIWPEILEMQAHGIEFQSHTVTHPHLAQIPLEEVRRELADSKAELEARLGRPVTALAYPYGNHSQAVRDLSRETGYQSAYSVGGGINRSEERIRISVASDQDIEAFAETLEGSWWGEASGTR